PTPDVDGLDDARYARGKPKRGQVARADDAVADEQFAVAEVDAGFAEGAVSLQQCSCDVRPMMGFAARGHRSRVGCAELRVPARQFRSIVRGEFGRGELADAFDLDVGGQGGSARRRGEGSQEAVDVI